MARHLVRVRGGLRRPVHGGEKAASVRPLANGAVLAYLPGGRVAAVGADGAEGPDRDLRRWKGGHSSSVGVAADASAVVVADDDGSVACLAVAADGTVRETAWARGPPPEGSRTGNVVAAASGSVAAVLVGGGAVRLVDAGGWREGPPLWSGGGVAELAVSPSGAFAAVSAEGGVTVVLDASAGGGGREVARWNPGAAANHLILLDAPGGEWALVCGDRALGVTVRTPDGGEPRVLVPLTEPYGSAGLHATGVGQLVFAVSDADFVLSAVEWATGRVVATAKVRSNLLARGSDGTLWVGAQRWRLGDREPAGDEGGGSDSSSGGLGSLFGSSSDDDDDGE